MRGARWWAAIVTSWGLGFAEPVNAQIVDLTANWEQQSTAPQPFRRNDPPPAPVLQPPQPMPTLAPSLPAPAPQPLYAPMPSPYLESTPPSCVLPGAPSCVVPSPCTPQEALCGSDAREIVFSTFSTYNSWRGIADASGAGPATSLQTNFGAVSGFNLGAPIPMLDQLGIGLQLGGSYGVYDFMGRPTAETNRVQQQFFATTGVFRRATEAFPISAGFAHDWMINDNFGAASNEPFLGQWRAQVGAMLGPRNEIGVWGTWLERPDARGGINYRPISQYNVFWHHYLPCAAADTWLWVGVPHRKRGFGGNGSLGEFIVGGAWNVPFAQRMATFGSVSYMRPSASAGIAGSTEEAYDFQVGLAFYPGCKNRARSVAGRSWAPLMPVANNGSFWVDAF